MNFKFSLKRIGIVCGAVAVFAMPNAALSQDGTTPKETPEAFLAKYYQSLQTATSVKQLLPLYTPGPDDPTNAEILKNPMFDKLALMMIKTEPRTVKVISKTATPGKVTLELVPAQVPAEFAKNAKEPGFSMKGSVILVADKGNWKVHKDFWTVNIKNSSGSSKQTFGRNPDKTKGDTASDAGGGGDNGSPSVGFDDFDRQFVRKITDAWDATGKGKLFAVLHLGADGKLLELTLGGDKSQTDSITVLANQFKRVQTFPALPKDQLDRPYAWMEFDWNGEGRAISGPYFGSEQPQDILDKMETKSKVL